MKICGIIVEYNPFHNGHLYHIEQVKKKLNPDCLIAVMSPNFVQRGEPAIMDKWDRVELALHFGIDIVVELPTVYATQSAQQFAQASTHILNLMGVKHLLFGSECNDIEKLKRFANYPIQFHDKDESLVRQQSFQLDNLGANDILGTCYIRAIQANNYTITAHTIQRTNTYHDNQLIDEISSATAIRSNLVKSIDISPYIPYQEITSTVRLEDYYPTLQTILFNQKREELASLLLMDEGIEGLLKKEAIQPSLDAFLNATTNRRYTKSRIRRTLIHTLLQTKRSEVPLIQDMKHVRILGFNKTGQNYLKLMRKKEEVSIVTRLAELPPFFKEHEMKASFTYKMHYSSIKREEMRQKELRGPIIKK